MLEGRVLLAAAQARSLVEFWAILLRRMLWPAPQKARDEQILTLLTAGGDAAVLRSLAGETASLVMIARFWHDTDKKARRASETEPEPATAAGLFD